MVSDTREIAFEQTIEKHLVGFTSEEIHSNPELSEISGSWIIAKPDHFNPQYALDTQGLEHFLDSTQPDEMNRLRQLHPVNWREMILERFDKGIKKNGILYVLKKGLAIKDVYLTLVFPPAPPGAAEKARDNFNTNQFSVMRQVPFNSSKMRQTIDMVLLVNGIPLITLELKTETTGQTARSDGQKQYRRRDFKQPLLQFGRCLVHMAVDTVEVWMTTKLEGKETKFLPFNKGHDKGQGNPPNPQGHKTAYLWQDIFKKESLAKIIFSFARLDGKHREQLSRKTLIFPRYHQLDVVRKLLDRMATDGTGHKYLIQHSAGSGKTHSITWTAFHLIELCPANVGTENDRNMDSPLFDSVIVVSDRKILDQQLTDSISSFSDVKNIIASAEKSEDLKSALEKGKKIITTTIWKFPYIVDGMLGLEDRNFAVIIDEAHSSQSGITADLMNTVLGTRIAEHDSSVEPQDYIIQTIRNRKMCKNASYLAFTATPKQITLEKFGEKQSDGSFLPFHDYSMKQAIQEEFILDVLRNYSTYNSYYHICKSVRDNPDFNNAKAQKRLRNHVEARPETINAKAKIILEHFKREMVDCRKLRNQARGMVVTSGVAEAIRYYLAIQEQLDEIGNPFRVLIAFSGEKEVNGVSYTEAGMNGFPDKKTAKEFDEGDYRLLVVADKYQTGFDQPKLCAMYIDKRLQDVNAVQTLSRLNRAAPDLGKRPEDLRVLDFVNNVSDIRKSFEPYFIVTELCEVSDVNILHDLLNNLDDVGIYEKNEIDQFADRFFSGANAQTLSPLIDQAAERFNSELDLEDIDKADLKIKAKHFVKIYGQLASILPYEVVEWEKRFWFFKFLIPKLKVLHSNEDDMDALLQSVDLTTYGIMGDRLNQSITLDETDSALEPQNPNPRGAHEGESALDPLDQIIVEFNDMFDGIWKSTPEEKRIVLIKLRDGIQNHQDYQIRYIDAMDPQNRDQTFEEMLNDIIHECRKKEMNFYQLYSKDEAFKSSLTDCLKRAVALLPDTS